MESMTLWCSMGVLGAILLALLLQMLDRLLLRAEAKGWIYYRKKRAGGTLSSGIAGMMELDRLVRPSVEHVIEVQHPVVQADQKSGE